jgi:hypothetical protein
LKRGHRRERIAVDQLRLQAGSHRSPREGVCVVELASAVAGERFSDRPRCVCKVIAAFLRAWNDRAGYADRQRLAPYAARIVDTRASRRVTRLRRDVCLIWAGVDVNAGPLRSLAARLRARLRILVYIGVRPALFLNEGAGELAARALFAEHGEDIAFAMLDRLLAVDEDLDEVGMRSEPAPLADPVPGPAHDRVAATIRQRVGDAQVAYGEKGRNGQNGNGDPGNLDRRDAGDGDEEHVENDGAGGGDPERQAEVQKHLVAG